MTTDSKTTTDIVVSGAWSEPMTIQEVKKAMLFYDKVKTELLTKDDMQAIAGKQFVKRSGWRKVALAFALSDRIVSEKRTDRADGSFVWHIVVEVSTQAGRTCTGSGACDTNERKAREAGKSAWAHIEHDVYATAHTRAKNRAISDMVAAGALSAEELEGATSEEEVEPAAAPIDSDSLGYEFEKRLEKAGLDVNMIVLEPVGNIVIGRLVGYVGDWKAYNDVMLGLGFRYVRDKKHWERGE